MRDRGVRRKFSIGQGGRLTVSYPSYTSRRHFAGARADQLESLLTVLSGEGFDELLSMPDGYLASLLYLASEMAGEVVDALDDTNSNDGSNA